MANHGVLTVGRDQRTQITSALWQTLSGTGILVAVGATVLILFFCALLIHQMPGQIADDPAAATRWLLTVSEEYGVFGGALRTLGLFDVLHHPLLQLLLAIVALILLVHLGNMIAALWRFWQVAHWVDRAVAAAGDPVVLPNTQPLYRLRQAASHTPQQLIERIAQEVKPHFDETSIITVNTLAYHEEVTAEPLKPAPTEEGATPEDAAEMIREFRLFARRHQRRWNWLRPLLIVGLLFALIAVWIILLAGWEVAPPLLAPGDEYRATTQRVALAYTLPTVDDDLTPSLSIEIDEATYHLPLGQGQQLRWGQIAIAANSGPPALLLRSADDATTLSRPGQTQHMTDLGLIFPTLGSEDSVVVNNNVGLRIVRVAALAEAATDDNRTSSPVEPPGEQWSDQFLVEVYQRDEAKPVQTLHIHTQTRAKLRVGGETRELLLIPLPSIAAIVRYQPGIWLLWLALLFVIFGVVGFCYQPAFLIVQVAPWPIDRAVLIAQSDSVAEIDRIRLYLK